jgi:alpha,alpha-trehalose phosphorylase
VLAMHFRGDAFSDEEKLRNFDYYEALTVRDSSLSACTQAVIAAEVGHMELAFDYFGEAALIDVDDIEHNTRDGLHIASLAGAWLAAVAGFGGMRHHGTTLLFKPRLPRELMRLSFGLGFRGRQLRVEVKHKEATYTLRAGEPLDVRHYGELISVSADAPQKRPIPRLPAREAPQQPHGRAPVRRQRQQ